MKNPIRIISALLLITIAYIGAGGCTKKGGNPSQPYTAPKTYYADSAFASHFTYKPGTYWIYRDSLTGRTDSFYVSVLDSSYNINDTGVYPTEYGPSWYAMIINQRNIDGSAPGDSSKWICHLQAGTFYLDYYVAPFNIVEHHYDMFWYPLRYIGATVILEGDTVSASQDLKPANIIGSSTVDSAYYLWHRNPIDDTIGLGETHVDDHFILANDLFMQKISINHPYRHLRYVWVLQRYHMIPR